MKIHLRAEYADVAHVGGQPRKSGMDIHALSIPLGQSMNSESMPKIIGTRPHATTPAL
jgi:hypothetical protein